MFNTKLTILVTIYSIDSVRDTAIRPHIVLVIVKCMLSHFDFSSLAFISHIFRLAYNLFTHFYAVISFNEEAMLHISVVHLDN